MNSELGRSPERVLEPIVHRIHEPGNRGAQLLLGLPGVSQSLVERERLHVVAGQFRVGQRLVDEEELHVLRAVVPIHRLQTGDVPQERRSGQAAERQHRVVAAQVGGLDLLAVGACRRSDSGSVSPIVGFSLTNSSSDLFSFLF